MAELRNRPLRLAYYADDFTGSTDALDFLQRAGFNTVLFLDPPDCADLEAHPEADAIGVAGMTRSLPTDAIRPLLKDAFSRLKDLRPDFVHYKVCSTFDSSAQTGSIGAALELGRSTFPAPVVPLLVGNPSLGRYCLFGNLFAHMGTIPHGPAYRIDKHPSMARHPVTPARDGDLRDHLARQTPASTALLDILDLDKGPAACEQVVAGILQQQQPDALLLDILRTSHFPTLGHLLEKLKPVAEPLFIIGSSAVEAALCSHWLMPGKRSQPALENHLEMPFGPVLVISGSCSPVTAEQIKTAIGDGFAEIAIDPDGLWRTKRTREIGLSAAHRLANGQSVILQSCLGPDDPRLHEATAGDRSHIGQALGNILLTCISESRPAGICFAGGDTSSEMARILGIRAMEWAGAFAPGAPICRAIHSAPSVNGLLFNFKGGQVGGPDYFLNFRKGFR